MLTLISLSGIGEIGTGDARLGVAAVSAKARMAVLLIKCIFEVLDGGSRGARCVGGNSKVIHSGCVLCLVSNI